MQRKQTRTSLYAIIAAVVLLAAGMTYAQLVDSGRAPNSTKLTSTQQAQLTAKRKPFLDNCVTGARRTAGGSDEALRQYCECSLRQAIDIYYRKHNGHTPPADDVANLTDADAVLAYIDTEFTMSDIGDIARACVANLHQ